MQLVQVECERRQAAEPIQRVWPSGGGMQALAKISGGPAEPWEDQHVASSYKVRHDFASHAGWIRRGTCLAT